MSLRSAIVGAGHIARQHLDAIRSSPGAAVVGVCDLSRAMAESTAEREGVDAWFTDFAAMLADVKPDVVHVTTPAPTHYSLATQAIDAGAHVFIEKPITSTVDELDDLLHRGATAQRLVIEDQNYLFNPTVQRLLEHQRSGELGEVVHVEVAITLNILGEGSRFADRNAPHPSLSQPGGAISDFLPHMASLAYPFIGAHRAAQTLWRKRDASNPLPHDEMRALIDGEHASACLTFSAHAQPDAFWIRVLGTKMRAEAHLFEPRLIVESLRSGPKPLIPFRNGLAAAGAHRRAAFGGLRGKLSGTPGAYEGLWELIRRTYRSIERREPAPIPPTQLREVARLTSDLLAQGDRS